MKNERLVVWVDSLSPEQLKKVCIDSVSHLITTEDVRFPSGAKRPYWESCGDSIDGNEDIWEE